MTEKEQYERAQLISFQPEIKKQLVKKTLIISELVNKKKNKKLSKYYRQLGEIVTNFEDLQDKESNLIYDILKLKRINQLENIGELRSESQKKAIIDLELRGLHQKKTKTNNKNENISKSQTPNRENTGGSRSPWSSRRQSSIQIQRLENNKNADLSYIVGPRSNNPGEQLRLSTVDSIDNSTLIREKTDEKEGVDFLKTSFRAKQKRGTIDGSSSPKASYQQFSPSLKPQGHRKSATQITFMQKQMNKNERKSHSKISTNYKSQSQDVFQIQVNSRRSDLQQSKLIISPKLKKEETELTAKISIVEFHSNSQNQLQNQFARNIGTPFIDKRKRQIKVIKPAGVENIEYSAILPNPMDLNIRELYSPFISSTPQFVKSIKSPQLDPKDIYNKVVMNRLEQRKLEKQGLVSKPPLNSKQSLHVRRKNMNQNQANFSKTQTQLTNDLDILLRDIVSRDQSQVTSSRPRSGKLAEITPMKMIQDLKSKLKTLLKDNQKQIEQMNEDTMFYQECRDLMNNVFDRNDHGNTSIHRSFDETTEKNQGQEVRFLQSRKNSRKEISISPPQRSKLTSATKHQKSKSFAQFVSDQEMIPLIYFDKQTNKTIVKLEASLRDRKKARLIRELYDIRKDRNKIVQVLEKVLRMYDVVSKEKFEKQKTSTPRTIQRIDQKLKHLQELVTLCADRFNYVVKEKTRILDDIFHLALPKQKNPLASLTDMAKINNVFLDQIQEDENAYQSKINAIGLSGNFTERLTFLNLMHKSLQIFQNMIARKVQEMNSNVVVKVMSKRFSPRNVVLPTGMETSIIIENFELNKNYFENIHPESPIKRRQREIARRRTTIRLIAETPPSL